MVITAYEMRNEKKEIQVTSSTNDFILEAVSFFNCFFLFARSSSEVQNKHKWDILPTP